MIEKRHSRYLEVIKKMKEYQGDLNLGETEVETDYDKIVEIEKTLQQRFLAKGLPIEYGDLGVVFENPWYAFLNEPVYFSGLVGE